jgi:internalin A
MTEDKRDRVFISYSHKDRRWLNEIRTMLHPLLKSDRISVWSDQDIGPGDVWRAEIERSVATAKVGVLLVSPNFLASDFITRVELPSLLADARRRGLTILWVPFSDCLVEGTEIARYHAVVDPKRPLDSLPLARRNAMLKAICNKVQESMSAPLVTPRPDAAVELAGVPAPA